MANPVKRPCHVVHLVYSFSIGGLENVIVQLINGLPHDQYRHTVIALTKVDADFTQRVKRSDVDFIALNKAPGQPFYLYPHLFRLLRKLRPDILHTCNLAALEFTPVAWAAGVPRRIHAEHGWDAHDPDGSNPRYQRIRKLFKPFVNHYIAVSQDLDRYLQHKIGIAQPRRTLIANGVDTETFSPAIHPATPEGCPFQPRHHWLAGTVGRMQTVKNQPFLAKGFVRMLKTYPEAAERARLILIGDGPLREEVERILTAGDAKHLAWIPGARSDIDHILKVLDCFVLPSRAEGTSCTLQEAMSCGLPAIATAVGGTPQLVDNDKTGTLIASDDEFALSEALWRYYRNSDLLAEQGRTAREKALAKFSIAKMLQRYEELFVVP